MFAIHYSSELQMLTIFSQNVKLLNNVFWSLSLEENVFSKQSTTAADIATPKISSKSDHWFKSYGHYFPNFGNFTNSEINGHNF